MPSAQAWTPADLPNLALRLDAADAGTLWADTNAVTAATHNGPVARWNDKRCTRSVTVTGKHGFCIEQLDMEIAGPGQTDEDNRWQATDFNIYDPENLGSGDINYWVVEGNVGAVEKFTRNGGASIRARRIGSSRGCATIRPSSSQCLDRRLGSAPGMRS